MIERKIKLRIPVFGNWLSDIFFKLEPKTAIKIKKYFLLLDIINNKYEVSYVLGNNYRLWNLFKKIDMEYSYKRNIAHLNEITYKENELTDYILNNEKTSTLNVYKIKYKQNQTYFVKYWENYCAKFNIKDYLFTMYTGYDSRIHYPESSKYDYFENRPNYLGLNMNINILEKIKLLDFIKNDRKEEKEYPIVPYHPYISYISADGGNIETIINDLIDLKTESKLVFGGFSLYKEIKSDNSGVNFYLQMNNNKSKYKIYNYLKPILFDEYQNYFKNNKFKI